jgi:hypothetical protein
MAQKQRITATRDLQLILIGTLTTHIDNCFVLPEIWEMTEGKREQVEIHM